MSADTTCRLKQQPSWYVSTLPLPTTDRSICSGRAKLDHTTHTNFFNAFVSVLLAIKTKLARTTQQRVVLLANLGSEYVRQRVLLAIVVTHCYNKAVDNERALNKHYEAFSSQTYGETSYNRISMIIEEVNPSQADVFFDLGSGVGQVVAHMAGGSRVKEAYGIEIAPLPAKFAARLEEEFRKYVCCGTRKLSEVRIRLIRLLCFCRLTKFYGVKHRPFTLEKGDFLNPDYRELITEKATIIFINNYAFTADLETRIKNELLAELKNGTRIISTKPYAPVSKSAASVTERQLSSKRLLLIRYQLIAICVLACRRCEHARRC